MALSQKFLAHPKHKNVTVSHFLRAKRARKIMILGAENGLKYKVIMVAASEASPKKNCSFLRPIRS